jgi:hypothetical protein
MAHLSLAPIQNDWSHRICFRAAVVGKLFVLVRKMLRLPYFMDADTTRSYHYAAVTDHSYGLPIAGGMSMAEAVQPRTAIDDVNAERRP